VKVEIWSDIQCPFCYIGKRHFEAALASFDDRATVEVVWRSFQLDPTIPGNITDDLYDYLAKRKGQSRAWSIGVHEQLVQSAKAVGLTYNFDRAVVSNSFLAHCLIQMAKTANLGDTAEERLFKAYFTEGQNIGDPAVLAELGTEIGLERNRVAETLSTVAYAEAVRADIAAAQAIGVPGVPFFLFDQKLAVTGAQPTETFLTALQQTAD
jgi:predicted DsbA family dithiol-disulfide isomerase